MANNEKKYFKLTNSLDPVPSAPRMGRGTGTVNLNLKNNYSYLAALGSLSLNNTPVSLGIRRYYSIFFKNIGKQQNKYDLSYYLAGLFEGDGYITINNKNKVVFAITFNIKDMPLAKKILKNIGIGHIVKRKSNSIELRFTSKISLCKIILLINGKLRTPKIHQFFLLID
jgi:hypothetical protein